MAKQVVTTTVCDMDGTPGARTTKFSLDDRTYTIDLSEKREEELLMLLGPYIKAATPVTRSGPGRPMTTGRTARAQRDENRRIRAWWAGNGAALGLKPMSGYGRVPDDVRKKYKEYDGKPVATTANQPTEDPPAGRTVPVAAFAHAS